jgi:hypothetical protein
MRMDLHSNYLIPTSLYYQVRKALISAGFVSLDEFPRYVALTTLFGFLTSMSVAIFLLVYVLAFKANPRIAIATVCAMALIFTLRAVPTAGLTQSEGLMFGPLSELPFRILVFFIKPDVHMDFGTYLQKGQFFLLFLAIISLRWSGKMGSGYLVLFIASLYHQVMAWLILGPFLLLDLLLRPRTLLERASVVGLGLVLGHALLDHQRLTVVAEYITPITTISAAVLGIVIISGFFLWWLRHPVGIATRENLISRGYIVSDLVGLSIIWISILIISIVATLIIGRYEWLFWGVIAGRELAILRMALIAGGLALLFDRFVYGCFLRERLTLIVGCNVMLIVIVVQFIRMPDFETVKLRITEQTQKLEQSLKIRKEPGYQLKDEAVFLYGMIKSMEFRKDLVTNKFR